MLLTGLSAVGYSAFAAETITVAATKYPNAEILNGAVKPLLAKQGYELKVQEFPSYNDQRIAKFFRLTKQTHHLNRENPNFEVLDKKADANFFQHAAYLEYFNEDYGDELQSVEGVFYVPYALYPSAGVNAKTVKDLAHLVVGATVYIPDGGINEERALRFLEQQKLIELKKGAGYLKVSDIKSNPRKLKISAMDEVTLPTMLKNGRMDFVVMNSGQAITNGILFASAIASEADDTEYENILVARKDNAKSPKVKALAEALHSPEVKAYIKKTYHGEVVPVF